MLSRAAMLLAWAPAALAAPALAVDVPGSPKTKATLPVSGTYAQGTFETAGDSDWYRVTLQKGHDYGVSTYANCGITFGVRDSAGRLLASEESDDYIETGFEFRPSYSGTYFVEYRQVPDEYCGPIQYPARIMSDCRADKSTTCRLRVGTTQRRITAWSYDEDWFRVELSRGRTYRVTGGGADVSTQLIDGDGFILAIGAEPFRPSSSGAYFVRVYTGNDDGQAYQVGLTAE